MSKVLSYEDFLNEAAKAYVSPEIVIAQGIAKQNQKISDLKKQMMEKPEMRNIIAAKIQVELEKIDSLEAKRNLMSAKEFEEQRKEREKVEKLRDKASLAAQKAAAAKRKG
jgi:hypothetical protein